MNFFFTYDFLLISSPIEFGIDVEKVVQPEVRYQWTVIHMLQPLLEEQPQPMTMEATGGQTASHRKYVEAHFRQPPPVAEAGPPCPLRLVNPLQDWFYLQSFHIHL